MFLRKCIDPLATCQSMNLVQLNVIDRPLRESGAWPLGRRRTADFPAREEEIPIRTTRNEDEIVELTPSSPLILMTLPSVGWRERPRSSA